MTEGDPLPRSLEWLASTSWAEQVERVVARAVNSVTSGAPEFGPGDPLVVVTKAPHGNGVTATAAIAARCALFGLHVRSINRIPPVDALAVAQTLYTDAWVHYRAMPRSKSMWSIIDRTFANDRFEQLFGTPFKRSMVVPAASALEDNGLTEPELARIWDEGRSPVAADVLTHRYGAPVAEALTGGHGSYEWYRGPWPIGVHRLAPSLFAFALRHERLYGGAPVVVLNGNFLLLSSLFGSSGSNPDDMCSIIAVTIPTGVATVAQVRRWLIGEFDDPAECQPGTVRYDAWAGTFPSASNAEVRPWSNVVHCSDGYLAGLIETRGLLRTDGSSALLARLVSHGYDPDELAHFVLADPVIRTLPGLKHVTQQTKGLDVAETLAWITTTFPPTFGPANSYGAGLSVARFAAAEEALLDDPDRTELGVQPNCRPLARSPLPCQSLFDHAAAGSALIGGGGVAMGVPAAGTGGRFGGYDVPEGHPRRMKVLADVITVADQTMSALDVRFADRAYWQSRGATIPVAVTASGPAAEAIRRWVAALDDPRVSVLDQPGVFRWSLDTLREGPLVRGGQAGDDFLLREPDMQPMLKPAGSLGLIAMLMLSGLLSKWAAANVRYLAIANSDDVGARLEPSVLGYLEAHNDIDAAVLCVPEPLSGNLPGLGRVWCDLTGWSLTGAGPGPSLTSLGEDGTGRFAGVVDAVPVESPLGGWVSETELQPGRWSVTVAERARLSLDSWYSTNQIYLRVSSLLELMADGPDTVTAVRRLRDRLPMHAEQKQVVDSAGKPRTAVQVFQPVSAILHALHRTVPVSVMRSPRWGQRTGYAPLKNRADVPLANAFLREAGAGSGPSATTDWGSR